MIEPIPKRSPDLLLRMLDSNYGFAVNCSFPNSFRVINKIQYDILASITNTDNIVEIAHNQGIKLDDLKRYFSLLIKSEIIRFDDNFSTPIGEHHEDKKSEDCKTCRYRSVCTSGCPIYRVKDKDPNCSLYHKFIPMYYELQAQQRIRELNIYTNKTQN